MHQFSNLRLFIVLIICHINDNLQSAFLIVPQAAALFTLLVVVAVNLALGILPRVDNFAHIGGFLTGFLLGFVLLPRPQFGWLERQNLPAGSQIKSKYKPYQYVLWLVSLVLLIAG
ncbi:hypothetical protein SLEP1_g17066 [Rubroshorea leprosula]|uniref:RHOMBOID-like protein n=1 Tax=Rubroshorea leprosula TaxID=152421 RepID=A0AAV5IYJ3_9ROSI|nr:hypothetical protein SLEP1_g17066 [Rubroshorea leprosula]